MTRLRCFVLVAWTILKSFQPNGFLFPTVVGSSSSCDDDDDSISSTIPVSKLTPNQFHKICPSSVNSFSSSLGTPMCGDGTAFRFFVSKPMQRKANNEKILIEFMGGGACWSEETCDYAADYLTFPESLNEFVGKSCSEIAYTIQNMDGFPISMLCSRPLGETDFSEYTTIVVPYCTQDVHLGDQTITYNDNNNNGNGDESTVIHHMGGHNTMAVLRWIFKNFPRPTHIALTGCSAGGTALPVAYDLIRRHYNNGIAGRMRTVQISTIMDSPVYLTPSYFLENGFPNWNPQTIMKQIGFKFNKWQYSEDYPNRVMDHVLKRGPNKDQWGFVSHTNDPVSQVYYKWMSGNGDDGNNDRKQRGLEENNDDDDNNNNEWFSATVESLNSIKKRHKNVHDYYIEGDSHCSFGLYYPLLDEGFESWASEIVKEQNLLAGSRAVSSFFLAVGLGAFLFAGTYFFSKRKERQFQFPQGIEGDRQDSLLEGDKVKRFNPVVKMCGSFADLISTFPITASYALAVTFYFWMMIATGGIVHPLNNPSLGPNAITLSNFGINNPALIVYRGQIYRLLSSSLLCSGVLTYAIVMIYLWICAKPLETRLRSPIVFGTTSVLICLGSNMCYALLAPGGASCSSMAYVLGLNAFYLALRQRLQVDYGNSRFGCNVCGIVFIVLLVALIFPFNSWIMLLSGIGVGILVAVFVVTTDNGANTDADPCATFECPKAEGNGPAVSGTELPVTLNRKALTIAAILLGLVGLPAVFLRRIVYSPDEIYLQPFYTGCTVMYAKEEDVANIMDNFDLRRRDLRRLEYDYDNLCAEFCIPEVAAQAAYYGAPRVLGLPLAKGRCDEIGFEEHMADKTFSQLSYSLDVEIFAMSSQDDEA